MGKNTLFNGAVLVLIVILFVLTLLAAVTGNVPITGLAFSALCNSCNLWV